MTIQPVSLDGPIPVQNAPTVSRATGISGGQDSVTTGEQTGTNLGGLKTTGGVDPQKIQEAVEAFNRELKGSDIILKFSLDEESGGVVVQIVNQTTGETLRQFPSAEMLHLSATLGKLQGKLFSHKA
jgi:flagellar protein FlaG